MLPSSQKCPGNLQANLNAEIYTCPCGYGVEIFSDEIRRKCPRCGRIVTCDRMPGCIDWCPAAKECVGEEKWKELQAGRKKAPTGSKPPQRTR